MSNQALHELNELARKHFPELLRSSPAYTYFTDARGSRYFYTKEKVSCKHGNGKHYQAGIYRYYKTKKMHKLVRKVCFAKKKRAIAWAEKEHDKAVEREEQRMGK